MSSGHTAVGHLRNVALGLIGAVGLVGAVIVPGVTRGPVALAVSPDPVLSLVDDTGLLSVDVPATWTDASTAPAQLADGAHARIVATPDQPAFYDTYTTPGLIYTGLDFNSDSVAGVTEQYDFAGECTDAGVEPYSDGYFAGSMQTWTGCDGTAARVVTIFASPRDRSFSAGLLIQVPTSADDVSLQTVLSTFYVVSPTTVDDSGLLTLQVPSGWTAVATAGAESTQDAGVFFPQISAAQESTSADGWSYSGVTYTALPVHADLNALLATNLRDCARGTIQPYDDGYFVGVRQNFTNCGSAGSAHAVNVAATPSDGRFTAFVSITIADPADEPAVDAILDSFDTTGIAPSYEMTDATGLITMRAPSWWSAYSVETMPDSGTGAPLPSLGASAPGDAGAGTGVWFQAFDQQTPDSLVEPFSAADRCSVDEGTTPYDDGDFVGVMRTWSNCDGSPSAQEIQVFAAPADGAFSAVVIFELAAPDQDAVDLVLGSFNVASSPPQY